MTNESTPAVDAENEIAVRLSGVAKTYRRTSRGAGDSLRRTLARVGLGHVDPAPVALHPLDLDVPQGQAIGIVGRNGSGKSTLLRLLAGTLRPSRGELTISGRVGSLLELGAGIDPEFTGAENAHVLSLLAGLSGRDADDRLAEIHAFSGLGEAFHRPVKSYSSGMIMRLGFSASVCTDPEVLLIDEALAVGDAFFQQRCLRRMRELRSSGVTIVLVSHDPSAVISLCDRTIWLESGAVVEDGRPETVIKHFLAARYRDDCELDGAQPSRPGLSSIEAGSVAPARGFMAGPNAERFGDGRASLLGGEVRGTDGRPLSLVRPGDPVEVVISARANEPLEAVLIGLTLRNRLGDVVAATNTEIEGVRVPAMTAGSEIDVVFRLPWPPLTAGNYSLSPAIADGNVAAHRMCDWVEDALLLECENVLVPFGWLALSGVEVGISEVRESSPVEPELPGAEARSVDTAGSDDVHVAFALESPSGRVIDGSQITHSRRLFMSGWSFAADDRDLELVFKVGDADATIVQPSQFREDVAQVHGAVPHAGHSGFGVLVALPVSAGPAPVVIDGRLPDGRSRRLAEFELDLPAQRAAIEKSAVPVFAGSRGRRAAGERAKVLYVSHCLNREGAPICLYEIATSIDPNRFEALAMAPSDGPLSESWSEAGVDLRILPVQPNQGGADDFAALIRRIAAMIAVRKPDLVVANTLETFWAVHVAEELGIPCTWIVHESEDPSSYFHSRLGTSIAEEALRSFELAEQVVFVSEATRSMFSLVLVPGRSEVIPNGLKLDCFDLGMKAAHLENVRRELELAEDDHLILCVGTTCIRKGQLELVRALVLLRDSGAQFHAMLLGVVEGEYLDRIRKAIEAGNLQDRVTLLPLVADPRPFFAAADQLVCPSFQESLPRVVQESMAFGVPVVASRVFGIPELIRDGSEGLLVDPGDVEALAAAMSRLYKDPALTKRLGQAARSRVMAEFTQRLALERYASLFDAMLPSAEDIDTVVD